MIFRPAFQQAREGLRGYVVIETLRLGFTQIKGIPADGLGFSLTDVPALAHHVGRVGIGLRVAVGMPDFGLQIAHQGVDPVAAPLPTHLGKVLGRFCVKYTVQARELRAVA